MSADKRRRPYPRRRQPRKTPFTAKMWERWLSEHLSDAHSQHLRAGIEDFRKRVIVGQEVTHEPA